MVNLTDFKFTNFVWSCVGVTAVVLGIKTLFTEDVSVSAANVQIELSNSKLETINQATKIKQQTARLQEIAAQLQAQQKAYLELQENYRALQERTINLLPALEQFEQPIVLDIPPAGELDSISEELDESDRELAEEIEKVSEIN